MSDDLNPPPEFANPPAPAPSPGAISDEKRLKKLRSELYRTPEIIAAHILMVVVSATLLFIGTPLLVVVVMAAFGSALILLTVMSGSHAMVVMTVCYFGLILLVVIADSGAGGAVLAAWMSLALFLSDFFRLNFARRRSARVDPRLFVSTLGFTFVVAVVATASTAIGSLVANGDGQRSWIWVPVASLIILVLISAATIAVARKPGRYDKRRYRPGERMLPQPVVD